MIYNILDLIANVESSESYKHFIKDQLLKLLYGDNNITNFNMNYFKNFIYNNIIYVDLNDKLEITGIILANYYKSLKNKKIITIHNHISINNDKIIKKSLLDTLISYIKTNFDSFELYIRTNEKNKDYYKTNNFEDLQQSLLKLNNV